MVFDILNCHVFVLIAWNEAYVLVTTDCLVMHALLLQDDSQLFVSYDFLVLLFNQKRIDNYLHVLLNSRGNKARVGFL